MNKFLSQSFASKHSHVKGEGIMCWCSGGSVSQSLQINTTTLFSILYLKFLIGIKQKNLHFFKL